MVLYYVPTARNTADTLTKALVMIPFREHRDVMLGFSQFPMAVAMLTENSSGDFNWNIDYLDE